MLIFKMFGQMFTCTGAPAQQDVCILTCVAAPGKQDACIATCSSEPCVLHVCNFYAKSAARVCPNPLLRPRRGVIGQTFFKTAPWVPRRVSLGLVCSLGLRVAP